MTKILFDKLADALAAVAPKDERQLLLVKFKAKEFFTLAESEDEAIAAVARSLGADCGAVPLDLILAAYREQLAGKPVASSSSPEAPPATTIKISTLSVAELKAIYRDEVFGKFDNAPEAAGMKRANFVAWISDCLPDKYADDKMEAVAAPAAEAPAK